MKPGLSLRTCSSPLAKPSLLLLQGRLVGNAATVEGVDGMKVSLRPRGFVPYGGGCVSLCSGWNGESHHRAMSVLHCPQFRFGVAVHGQQAGARLDPQLPARLSSSP